MPLTENELRDLLHERSAGAPASPDRVGAVRARVAKQRRRELAGVAAAMAVVVGAGVLWALPRNTAAPIPPSTSSPTPSVTEGPPVTTKGYGLLNTTVTGPSAIDGTGTFDVTLEVANVTVEPWTGTLGIGVVVEPAVLGMFEGGLVTVADSSDASGYTNLGMTMQDPAKQFDGVLLTDPVTLAPSEQRTFTITVQRNPSARVDGEVRGWFAYADQEGGTNDAAIQNELGSPIVFSPAASTLPCDTVQITSWDNSGVEPWTVDLAYTAVVGADGKATWEEISGLGDQGTSVTSTQTSNVRHSTIMAALGNLGAADPSGFGADLPDRPSTLDPGRYVAYSGTQLVRITFAGTCGPSGDPISGTWTAYSDRGTGLVDCDMFDTATPANTLAARAYAYCPKR
jgi:hypothetical protein